MTTPTPEAIASFLAQAAADAKELERLRASDATQRQKIRALERGLKQVLGDNHRLRERLVRHTQIVGDLAGRIGTLASDATRAVNEVAPPTLPGGFAEFERMVAHVQEAPIEDRPRDINGNPMTQACGHSVLMIDPHGNGCAACNTSSQHG